jgi:dihydroorotase
MTEEIIITKPDDMHLHLRDGEILKYVSQDTAKQFARAVAMPNLDDPIKTVDMANNYYQEIKKYTSHTDFEPLMAIYFSDTLCADELKKIKDSPNVIGVKLYPAGVTTNSKNGVSDIDACFPIFELMEKLDIPLLIHGEVNDPNVDIFDRENFFIDRYLILLHQTFPNLRIVFEHVSTKEAIDFVVSSGRTVAATITLQHLLFNRNDLFSGGISPHHYCLPVLKREEHRNAVLKAALSGNPKFFLGTDSAPHFKKQKETACGCAGIYSALTAIELYANIFEKNNAINLLENFSSKYGADFYNLPYNSSKIKLTKQITEIPESIKIGNEEIIPLFAGESIDWYFSTL